MKITRRKNPPKRNINNPTGKSATGNAKSKQLFEDGTYDLEEFHRVFIELEDPTEYLPAIALIGDWTEWNRIKRDWKGFRRYLDLWHTELELKVKSRAIQQVKDLAAKENLQASKWIAEEGWRKDRSAGRPTKAETRSMAKELAQQAAETKKDKARVLKLVGEGK